MLITINSGTVYFGANDVFEDIDFVINENEKIALVGRNGCGKTTLLKVLTGEVTLSKGNLIKPNKLKVGYLNQNSLIDCHNIVRDEMLTVFKPLLDMEEELNILSEKLKTDHSDKLINEYSKLEEEFKSKGGYTYNSEMETILFGFGFHKEDLDKNISSFSGGEKTKLAFAKLLLSKPDLLLLDEPFSALDYQTKLFVQNDVYNIIKKEQKAALIVTHDISEAIALSDKIIILSNRPCKIKKIFTLDFDKNLTPFQRRTDSTFNKYFKQIHYELNK